MKHIFTKYESLQLKELRIEIKKLEEDLKLKKIRKNKIDQFIKEIKEVEENNTPEKLNCIAQGIDPITRYGIPSKESVAMQVRNIIKNLSEQYKDIYSYGFVDFADLNRSIASTVLRDDQILSRFINSLRGALRLPITDLEGLNKNIKEIEEKIKLDEEKEHQLDIQEEGLEFTRKSFRIAILAVIISAVIGAGSLMFTIFRPSTVVHQSSTYNIQQCDRFPKSLK